MTASVVEDDAGQPNERLHRLWPVFPGFDAAFCSTWHARPVWQQRLDREQLLEASRQLDQHKRVFDVVNSYLDAMQALDELDEKIHVLICVIPDVGQTAARSHESLMAWAIASAPVASDCAHKAKGNSSLSSIPNSTNSRSIFVVRSRRVRW